MVLSPLYSQGHGGEGAFIFLFFYSEYILLPTTRSLLSSHLIRFKLRETERRIEHGFPWQQVYVVSDSVLHGTSRVLQRPISLARSCHNACMDATCLLLQVHILPAPKFFPQSMSHRIFQAVFVVSGAVFTITLALFLGPQTSDGWGGKVYFTNIFFLPMRLRTVAMSSGPVIPLSCFRWQLNVLPLILGIHLKLCDGSLCSFCEWT